MPALLNSRSSRPNSCLVAREQRLDRFRIADVGRHRERLGVAGFLRGLVELVGAPAGQHHGVAVLGERQRHRLADAGAGSRHDCDLLLRHLASSDELSRAS